MAAKLDNLIEGSYRHVKGDEYVQFCIKQGKKIANIRIIFKTILLLCLPRN